MPAEGRLIGTVKLVQVQQDRLKTGEKPNKVYDPAPLLRVDAVRVTPQGLVADMPGGESVLDVHNEHHPDTRYKGTNAVSVGFSGHYQAMRDRLGDHMTDGVAGENVIIEAGFVPALADLGRQLQFRNPATGAVAALDVVKVAAPCDAFTRFTHQTTEHLPADVMKETLQFLNDGRRGFLLMLADQAGEALISTGDEVLVLE